MTLNEICELIVDCEHKTAPTQDEGYPSIRTPNIGRAVFLLDGVNRVSEETYKLWTRRAVPKYGDLIMAREAPVGNVSMVPKGLHPCLGQRTLLIRPKQGSVDSRYLAYLLVGDEVQGVIHGMTNGATVPHLNMKDIRSLPLPPLPPLRTQRKIASILSAYDDLIENNTRRIAILEEMAQAIYREWFVNFRFPGHENAKLVDSPLGQIPEGWEVVALEKAVDEIIDYRGKTPKKLGGEWSDSGVLALSALNVKTGRLIKLDQAKCVDEKLYTKWMKSEVKAGDILVTSEAPLGEAYYVPDSTRYCLSQRLFSVRAKLEIIQSRILYQYLISHDGQSLLRERATGTTVSGIRQARLRELPVLVPDQKIQSECEDYLDSLMAQSHALLCKNNNLRTTRDLLLPKLISGQLDVEDLDIDAQKSFNGEPQA